MFYPSAVERIGVVLMLVAQNTHSTYMTSSGNNWRRALLALQSKRVIFLLATFWRRRRGDGKRR